MKFLIISLILAQGYLCANSNVHMGFGYENNIKYVKHGLHTYLGYEFFIFEYTKSDKWDTYFSKKDGYGGLLHINGFVMGSGVHMKKPYIKAGYKADYFYLMASVKHVTKQEKALAISLGLNFGSYSSTRYEQDMETLNYHIQKLQHDRIKYKNSYYRSVNDNVKIFSNLTNLKKEYQKQLVEKERLAKEVQQTNHDFLVMQDEYAQSKDSLASLYVHRLDSLDSTYRHTFDERLSGYKDSLADSLFMVNKQERKRIRDSLRIALKGDRIKKLNGSFNINGIKFGMSCDDLEVYCSSEPEQVVSVYRDDIRYSVTVSQKYGVVRVRLSNVYNNVDTYYTSERKYTAVRKILQDKYGGWWSNLSKVDDSKYENICDQSLKKGKVRVSIRFESYSSCTSKIPFDDTEDMYIVYFSPEYNKHSDWMKVLLSEKI